MNARATSLPRTTRPGVTFFLATVLAASFTVAMSPALQAAEASPAPEAAASPGPSPAPAGALCTSANDLRLIIGFMRDIDVSVDGWIPVLVGAIAALSEARQLAGLADETYRPLVDELIGALEGLRSTVDGLGELDTAGAKVTAIGEAITAIGEAMDALSVQLRSPCPAEVSTP